MGLAIVRAMLDAHGGTIRLIDSETGTAFELTIPLAAGSGVSDDRPRPCLLRRDHRLRPRPARARAPPGIAGLRRQIWRLGAVGNDGVLSGRDGCPSPVTIMVSR